MKHHWLKYILHYTKIILYNQHLKLNLLIFNQHTNSLSLHKVLPWLWTLQLTTSLVIELCRAIFCSLFITWAFCHSGVCTTGVFVLGVQNVLCIFCHNKSMKPQQLCGTHNLRNLSLDLWKSHRSLLLSLGGGADLWISLASYSPAGMWTNLI